MIGDDPEYPGGYVHNGSYSEEFSYIVDIDYDGVLYLRVFDSRGDFTHNVLLDIGAVVKKWLPGFPMYSILLGIVPIVAFLVWKTKRNS